MTDSSECRPADGERSGVTDRILGIARAEIGIGEVKKCRHPAHRCAVQPESELSRFHVFHDLPGGGNVGAVVRHTRREIRLPVRLSNAATEHAEHWARTRFDRALHDPLRNQGVHLPACDQFSHLHA